MPWRIIDLEDTLALKSEKWEGDAPLQSSICQLTNLSIGHTDQPLVHEFVRLGVPGLPLHDVALSLLISQGDGGNLGGRDLKLLGTRS